MVMEVQYRLLRVRSTCVQQVDAGHPMPVREHNHRGLYCESHGRGEVDGDIEQIFGVGFGMGSVCPSITGAAANAIVNSSS